MLPPPAEFADHGESPARPAEMMAACKLVKWRSAPRCLEAVAWGADPSGVDERVCDGGPSRKEANAAAASNFWRLMRDPQPRRSLQETLGALWAASEEIPRALTTALP